VSADLLRLAHRQILRFFMSQFDRHLLRLQRHQGVPDGVQELLRRQGPPALRLPMRRKHLQKCGQLHEHLCASLPLIARLLLG
jgi:hypothetical protein